MNSFNEMPNNESADLLLLANSKAEILAGLKKKYRPYFVRTSMCNKSTGELIFYRSFRWSVIARIYTLLPAISPSNEHAVSRMYMGVIASSTVSAG